MVSSVESKRGVNCENHGVPGVNLHRPTVAKCPREVGRSELAADARDVPAVSRASCPAVTRFGTPSSNRAMMDALSPRPSSYLCRCSCCCCCCDDVAGHAPAPSPADANAAANTSPADVPGRGLAFGAAADVVGRGLLIATLVPGRRLLIALYAATGWVRGTICGGKPDGCPAVFGTGGIPTIGSNAPTRSL